MNVSEALNEIFLSADKSTGGEYRDGSRPLVLPLDFSAAHEFDTEVDLGHYHDDKFNSHRYGRDSSSNAALLEQVIGRVNEGKSLAFSSGMSAIWAVLWSSLDYYDEIVTVGGFYRKSLGQISALKKYAGKRHIHVNSFDELDVSGAARPLLFIEAPSNPFLRIQDLISLKEQFPNALICYDNTCSGLGNERFNLGSVCDFVVASGTKYISGHNDAISGFVTCYDDGHFSRLWAVRSEQGSILSPMPAYLTFRGLKTFDLRFKHSSQSASKIVSWLRDNAGVKNIWWPGSECNSDQSDLFDRLYNDRGSVITFEISRNAKANELFSLRSCKMAPSFGSTDTLIERPATMSHHGKTEEELAALNLNTGIFRLSVGLEPIKYVLDDLEKLIGDY